MSRVRNAALKMRPYIVAILGGVFIGVVLFAISFVSQQQRQWAKQATWPETAYGAIILIIASLLASVGHKSLKSATRGFLITSATLLTIHSIPVIAPHLRGDLWNPLLSVSFTAFVELVIMSGVGAFLLAMLPAKHPRKIVLQVVAVALFIGAFIFWHWRTTKSGEIMKEEYEVYSAVVEQTSLHGLTVVVADYTVTPSDSWSKYHPAAGSLIAPFAVFSLQANNLREYPLQTPLIRQSNGALISETQYRKTSQGNRGKDWDFYKSHEMLWFSRVGFDPISRTAVVYVGNQFGSLGGEGDLVFLSKLTGKWRFQRRIPQWFS